MNEHILTSPVLKALDEVRPVLLMDDGDIELVNITPENIVEVKLKGNCKICPLSMMTLRAGIEATIKKYAPDVVRVEAVN